MARVDDGNGAVIAEALRDELVVADDAEEGARIGEPGGLDYHPAESRDLAAERLLEEIEEGVHERGLQGAADASRGEQHDRVVDLLHQLVIEPDAAELVDEDSAVLHLGLVDPVVEHGGLSASEKSGENGNGYALIF